MEYILLMYANESEGPKTPEEYQTAAPTWYAFGKEAEAAEVLLSNNGLSPNAGVPYRVPPADLLHRLNQRGAAAEAYERALALCGNPAERAHLQRRLDEMLNLKG